MQPLALISALLVGCVAGNLPVQAQVAPSVTLPSGVHVEGTELYGQPAYLGIRYASAKRFEVPEPWLPPAGQSINATQDGSACPQLGSDGLHPLVGEEDCLFLNVYTSAPNGDGKKPVMVWIHGGSLTSGSSSSNTYSFSSLVREGVVLVSLNYRLGVFGFFTASEASAPKNFGIRDQIEALRWVQTNVASFGGDPKQVTIFGESAGGLSVMALYHSPMAQGLFHRAISQSPGYQGAAQFERPWTAAAESMGKQCLQASGCDSLACLQQKSTQEVASACKDYFNPSAFVPVAKQIFAGADGEVLTEPLYSASCTHTPAANGALPLMIGGLTFEWRLFQILNLQIWKANMTGEQVAHRFLSDFVSGYEQADAKAQECARNQLKGAYSGASRFSCELCFLLGDPAWISLATDLVFTLGPQLHASETGGPRYRYLLDFDDGGGLLGSTHALDLCYLNASSSQEINGSTGVCGSTAKLAEKAQVSKMMRQYWASFAKTGVPQSDIGPKWEPVDGRNGLLGLPLLRFNLKNSSSMDTTAWYSNTSASLLSEMACGRLQLASGPSGDCKFTPHVAEAATTAIFT